MSLVKKTITKMEVEAAWDLEVRERIRRYDAGETKSIPATKVFEELDKRFGK